MAAMQRFRWLVVTICLAVATVSPASAAGPSLAGNWEGAIELPGQSLAVQLRFAAEGDGWSGAIDIPAQGARDLPLRGIVADAAGASFVIDGVPGDPTFKGEFADEGATLAGRFTQGGATFSFALARSGDSAAAAREALADLDGIIDAALADWRTPGLALAVVRDGQVLLMRGYGLRNVAEKLPVTEHTLFAIGSSSKAFTAMALGQLVDEGKLEWDAPVREYLPEFALKDGYASDHITPRDLVTHRCGLPRHDFVWYGNTTASREELVRRLRHLQPNRELRQEWQYNNLAFMTAGWLAGQLRGTTWEEVVRERILLPLGMERTNTSVAASQRDADHARPYRRKDEQVQEVAFRSLDAVGPAGSINSCVADMARWLLLNLGELSATGVIGDETLTELHTPQMVIPGMPEAAHETPAAYAMGWFTRAWRGHYQVEHGGHIDGFTAAVWLFPRDGVGIVALSNMDGDPLPPLVAAAAADRVLGLEPMDHIGTAALRRDQAEAVREQSAADKDRFRRAKTRPSRKLDELAGRYEDPGYGVVEFVAADDGLTMIYNGMRMPLDHWHYDVFTVRESVDEVIPEDVRVSFLGGEDGRISRVEAGFELMADPIVFRKLPAARLSDPVFLERLVGRYELPPQIVTVTRRDDRLVVSVPGQPALGLEPAGDDGFDLSGLTGYSVRFTVPDAGPATGLVFIQPNGVFEAARVKE